MPVAFGRMDCASWAKSRLPFLGLPFDFDFGIGGNVPRIAREKNQNSSDRDRLANYPMRRKVRSIGRKLFGVVQQHNAFAFRKAFGLRD